MRIRNAINKSMDVLFGWGRRDRFKREIIINAESLETRVAILENGRLEEFQVEHPTEQRIVGSVFKGRIQNLEHDLQAAFVDIGLQKNAFLHYWDMVPEDFSSEIEVSGKHNGNKGKGKNSRRRFTNQDIEKMFPAGSDIMVQVTKGPIGTKGPRVTASVSVSGRYLVLMPGSTLKGVSRKIEDHKEKERLRKILNRLPIPEEIGIIVRTAAVGARKSSFVRDLRGLLYTWQEMQEITRNKPSPCLLYQEPDLVERVVRDWLTEDVDSIVIDDKETFDKIKDIAGKISRRARARTHHYEGDLPVFDHYGVERQIEEAFGRHVQLKCGGVLVFDETEAMISIDVNSGRHKGKGSQDEAILEINTEAVEEVSRQLRLRNIGGLVVIDLIDMRSRKDQQSVYRTMKAALRRDKARTNVLQISELGLMEMTRQRVEESLHSAMYGDCPYCKGRGTVRSLLSMSVDIQRQIEAASRRLKKLNKPIQMQIIVHPNVLDRLRREDEEFLIEIEAQIGGQLSFKSDPSKHVEYFAIRDGGGDLLYASIEG